MSRTGRLYPDEELVDLELGDRPATCMWDENYNTLVPRGMLVGEQHVRDLATHAVEVIPRHRREAGAKAAAS
jgi:hypothetical protein